LYIGFDVFVIYPSYNASLKMATTYDWNKIHIASYALVFILMAKHQCVVTKYLKLKK